MTDLVEDIPTGRVHRPRFSIVWIIPIIAALIAGYLGYRTIAERGPLLIVTFDTADGLSVGQTELEYKSLPLGTVESLAFGKNHQNVIVKIRMTSVGEPFMRSNARFWVVRPSFSAAGISGLSTLVSGSYITLDPGAPGGHYQDRFTGLEEPPGVRSDEPGSTFILKADNIGSLDTGSPVYYRAVEVGEVLGYSIGNGIGPVTINIFVRAPYDGLVRPQSHFWNSSGISAAVKNGQIHIEVESLQALISGGVTFDVPPEAIDSPPSPDNSTFPLYPSEDAAAAAGYRRKIPLVTYFTSSVGGLTAGAPVEILGIQIGQVTDVRLVLDPVRGTARVRVAMDLQPERIFRNQLLPTIAVEGALQNLVNKGLRAELETANYITGEQVISFTMIPGAKPWPISSEGDAFVLPSQGSDFGTILASLNTISKNLAKMPLAEIGDNLNSLLITTNRTISSAEINQTFEALNETLATANTSLASLSHNYGNDSDFQQSLEQLMAQANDTLRSIDLLAAYLNRNPSALLRGRSGQ